MDLEKEYREKAEAILFASGRLMKFDEIATIGRFRNKELLKLVLENLKEEYEKRNSAVKIINQGDLWKMTIDDKHAKTIERVAPTTELSKAVTETLAVIAFKYPILQSDLIKIRSNKAYEHLKELEELGFITRQKHGRTRLIKLTQKFFEYFDLPKEKLKEQFKDFEEIAKSIEEKEKEIEKIRKAEKEIKPYKEEIGKLEVYEEKVKTGKKIEEKEEIEKNKEINVIEEANKEDFSKEVNEKELEKEAEKELEESYKQMEKSEKQENEKKEGKEKEGDKIEKEIEKLAKEIDKKSEEKAEKIVKGN